MNKKVKLLIVTQKVDINDPILGFFHNWLKKFSEICESVIVICLGKGEYNLPANVKVLSLGKEDNFKYSILNFKFFKNIVYILKFYNYIFKFRNDYDAVFVHMNSIYVVLGGLFWKLQKKKILLWYIHPKIDKYLRLAHFFADKILTAAQFSFPLQSNKVLITGHGIDIDFFKKLPENQKQNNSILYVGRISPVKNLEVLIEATNILHSKGVDFVLNIVGGRDERLLDYFDTLKSKLNHLENIGKVKFWGQMPNKEMPKICNQSEILVNLTPTGSFDKAILEAMACENLALVSNKAFEKILPNDFIFQEKDAEDLAQKIKQIFNLSLEEKQKYATEFREYIIKNHSLNNLIQKIKDILL